MPKKIKEKKETLLKKDKESLLNPDNVHILIIALAVVAVIICAIVGIYVYKEDEYHSHRNNAIVDFVYTEKLDEGYNVFSVTETDTKQIFVEFSSLDVQEYKEISRGKYLDFNEEIYNLELMNYMTDELLQDSNSDWSIQLKFADGTRKYLYSSEQDVDLTELSNIIKKYFKQETQYK